MASAGASARSSGGHGATAPRTTRRMATATRSSGCPARPTAPRAGCSGTSLRAAPTLPAGGSNVRHTPAHRLKCSVPHPSRLHHQTCLPQPGPPSSPEQWLSARSSVRPGRISNSPKQKQRILARMLTLSPNTRTPQQTPTLPYRRVRHLHHRDHRPDLPRCRALGVGRRRMGLLL